MDFISKGRDHRFRCFLGGNRTGKSYTGAYELAIHATGLYPAWWIGHRMHKPDTFWIVSESGALFRDSIQKVLFGNPGEEVGTGLIPKNSIIDYSSLPGIPGAYGRFLIKHKDGHAVSIIVKTYEMSREQFQAARVDMILFDEEPPEEVYTECVMRLMSVGKKPGIAVLLFTPVKGLSEVVLRYLPHGMLPLNGVNPEAPDRYVCQVTWDDAPHLSKDDKASLLAEIPINFRKARTEGVPTMGAGLIYPIDEKFIIVDPFEIPDYFPRTYGYDFGYHNTAVVWIAKDPSTGVYYVYSTYKRGAVADYVHAEAVKMKGKWLRGIADPSGGGRRDDGTLKIDHLRSLGLDLIPGHNALTSGISKVLNLMESGLLKFFSNCFDIRNETRVYKYDKSNPNIPARNQDDHLLDALRYALSRFDEAARSLDEHNSYYERQEFSDQARIDQSRDDLTGY